MGWVLELTMRDFMIKVTKEFTKELLAMDLRTCKFFMTDQGPAYLVAEEDFGLWAKHPQFIESWFSITRCNKQYVSGGGSMVEVDEIEATRVNGEFWYNCGTDKYFVVTPDNPDGESPADKEERMLWVLIDDVIDGAVASVKRLREFRDTNKPRYLK